jgi:hypothetical protein
VAAAAVFAKCANRVVDLDGQRFDRLVVSCDDPEAVAAEISRQ